MSKNYSINDSILRQFLIPSINYASIKARLRLNEYKKKFSKKEYKHYFLNCNNIISVTNSQNNKYTLKEFCELERKASLMINKEINVINKNLNIFEKKYKINNMRYRLKLINERKEDEIEKNRNDLVTSVKNDISKYLENLHVNDSPNINNKNMKKEIFSNLQLNLSFTSRNNLKTKSALLNSFDNNNNNINSISNVSTKSRNFANINKNKIKKFISIDESLEYSNLLENIKENNSEKKPKDNYINFKKFPFLRQNSCFSPTNHKVKFSINNKNNQINSINLPNIKS